MKEKYLSLAVIAIAALTVSLIVGFGQKVELEPAARGSDRLELAIPWSGMGQRLVQSGVIDEQKIRRLYWDKTDLLNDVLAAEDDLLIMHSENADIVLNALWAFGLANANPILDRGPMQDVRFGGPNNFASTGGWTLARQGAMDYYSKLPLVVLDGEQQLLVEEVSKYVYRPCCNNPTYFPDCNHGMAMLGLLELLAAAGATEAELYEAAEKANRLWFSAQYEVLDEYARMQRLVLTPKDAVGFEYMSGTGFGRVAAAVKPSGSGGASCSI